MRASNGQVNEALRVDQRLGGAGEGLGNGLTGDLRGLSAV
jgi:hypothetical protein